MSLRRRAAVSFLITITIVVIASAALARAFTDEVNRQSLITDRIEPAAQIAGALQAATARTAAGVAQYVVTGEGDERSLAQTSLDESAALLDSLGPLIAGEPVLRAFGSTVSRAHESWLAKDVKPTLADMAEGRRADAAARVDAPASQARFAELESANAQLITAIEEARSRGLTDLRRITRDLGVALAAAALLAIGLSAFSIIALLAWILAPLDRVRADLREAAALPSHETPIERTGPAEIAEVAGDAEALRRALLREIDAADAARIALEHGAPVVVALEREMAPPSATRIAGIDVSGTTRAAEGVIAGDWWDAVPLPDGGLGLVMADVSGHDLHAGVTAVGLRSVFRTGLLAGLAPDRVMDLAANGLRAGGRPVTAFIAILQPGSGLIVWANAGHPPPLIVRSDGAIRSCERTGQLLSRLGGEWRTSQAAFSTGDVCLAFTDGLVESLDDRGEELGQHGLVSLVEGLVPSVRDDPTELAERVIGRARLRATEWDADDITVLAFGWSSG
jgi:serine phosphatase RsbU (regulator of sigma subunit)/CHASE3 domain sensor protein